ncbi:MAG: cytochrome b [Enterobacterales bacterium]|nr:cytochrome b [Enterobacterales bacterium]
MLRNTESTYGKVTIIIHWLMVLMVVTLLTVGFIMADMDKGATRDSIIGLHKASGFVLLLLALFRWYWTLSGQNPKPIEGMTKAEIGISHAAKWTLLLLLLIMPISGVLMSMYFGYGISVYGLFEIPSFLAKNKDLGEAFEEIHEVIAYILIAVFCTTCCSRLKTSFYKQRQYTQPNARQII